MSKSHWSLKTSKNVLIYQDHKYHESHLMDWLEILYPRTRKLNVVQYDTIVLSLYSAWDFLLAKCMLNERPPTIILGLQLYELNLKCWYSPTRGDEKIFLKMFFVRMNRVLLLEFSKLGCVPVTACVSWQQEDVLDLEWGCSGRRNLDSTHQVHL